MNTEFGKIVAAMGLLMVAGMSAHGQVPVTSNLQLWLKADAGVQTSGSSVTNWLDQSGQGNHASPDAVGNQPTLISGALNGLPVVQFDGINDRLRAADAPGLDGGPGMTIFVVAKPLSFSQYPELLAKWDYGTDVGSYAFELEAGQNLFAFVVLPPGDGGVNYRFASTTAPIPPSKFSTLSMLYDGSQAANADRVKFFRNGGALPDGGGGGTIATTLQDSASPLTIGSFYGLGRYFDGQMSEVLLYNTALSGTERQDVVEYLNAKWAIPEASALTYLSVSGLAWLAVILRRR